MRTNSLCLALTTALLAISGPSQILPAANEPIDIYDGFESPALSRIWETSRMTEGAAQIQSEVVRAGHSAIRITLHSGDTFEAGKNGDADSERDELLEARALTSREDILYEFSWSVFLPPDFPIVPVRLVVAQWKQYCGSDSAPCSNDSPVLAIRYVSGVLRITQDISHHQSVLYREKRNLPGHWLDLRFQVRFTPKSSGRVKAWLDGKQVVDFTGITADPESPATGYSSPSHFYFKMGLYRNVMPQPMTIYLDEYRKKQLPPETF